MCDERYCSDRWVTLRGMRVRGVPSVHICRVRWVRDGGNTGMLLFVNCPMRVTCEAEWGIGSPETMTFFGETVVIALVLGMLKKRVR